MDGISFEKLERTPLMTLKELARLCHLSERTIWANTEPRGTIPVVRIGRSVRYCPNAVQEWMRRQMTGVNSTSLSA